MNKNKLNQLEETVALINDLDAQMCALSDTELNNFTNLFKQRLAKGESTDDLLPEAYAVVREASKRTIGLRHHDTQLMGGILLHQKSIAEISAGEGKTLVASLPVYLNALVGKGVHVVTLSDYLAQRDASWLGDLYKFLGLTVGVIVSGMEFEQRCHAYAADVTYAFKNELVFNYLYDNMAFNTTEQVQCGHNFAIVDDIDSILIDQAGTPVKITSESESDNTDLYQSINVVVSQLLPQQINGGKGDYSVDEKSKQVYLTEAGREHVETLLLNQGLLRKGETLHDARNKITLLHYLSASMKAHALYKKHTDYVVENQQIKSIDKATGQTSDLRWLFGVHEAIETKEGVPVQIKNKMLSTIPFQSYFFLYDGLAGMSGTAANEASEYQSVYGLEVNTVPQRVPAIREDLNDLVYLTEREKYDAVVEDIAHCVRQGDPVLVNCPSLEKSGYLLEQLSQKGIPSVVLDDNQEPGQVARIVVDAGNPGTVTIMTNLAGWQTDISLGDAAIGTGGLYVIGTERYESRRIDNKLRSLAGRRGNPGWSRFYLSLEDRLMQFFNVKLTSAMMQKLGYAEGEPMEHSWITKAIESSQQKLEALAFGKRKQLLECDDVVNMHRKLIYKQRNEVLLSNDISNKVKAIRESVINEIIRECIFTRTTQKQWDIYGIEKMLVEALDLHLNIKGWLDSNSSLNAETLRRKIIEEWDTVYQNKEREAGSEALREFEKLVVLQVLDEQWQEHLGTMELLREDIRLLEKITPKNLTQASDNSIWKMIPGKRAKAHVQNGKAQERSNIFAQSAGELFENLERKIDHRIISVISRFQIKQEEAAEDDAVPMTSVDVASSRENASEGNANVAADTPDAAAYNVARNANCPCGSGKRYKHCHGVLG